MTAGRVMVLGASGFIGSHVSAAFLARGFEVVGIGHGKRPERDLASLGPFRWIEGEITFEGLRALGDLGPFTCAVNCSGSGTVSYAYAQPWLDFHRSVGTTAALLEWARLQKQPTPRVLLLSSAAVYGDIGPRDACEDDACSPISPYGWHKVAAEQLCETYSKHFEVPATVIRLFSVYGEGLRKQLLWDALDKFSRGQFQFFGTGNESRDWVHVEDAAELVALAGLVPGTTFDVFNGGGVQASVRQVLKQLARAYGVEAQLRFSGEIHPGSPIRLTSCHAKASRQLGWEAQIPLQSGLRRYANWFKSL